MWLINSVNLEGTGVATEWYRNTPIWLLVSDTSSTRLIREAAPDTAELAMYKALEAIKLERYL
jgi:hypothetical protein